MLIVLNNVIKIVLLVLLHQGLVLVLHVCLVVQIALIPLTVNNVIDIVIIVSLHVILLKSFN